MKFKKYFNELMNPINLVERVSPDCSTGAGEITTAGPWKDFKVIRTSHLDDERNTGRERDHGFDCDTFDAIITKFLQKRPLGIKDGKVQLTWKNSKGYQAAVVQVSNSKKNITFVTIMQLNRKKATQYETNGDPSIDLGIIKEPN